MNYKSLVLVSLVTIYTGTIATAEVVKTKLHPIFSVAESELEVGEGEQGAANVLRINQDWDASTDGVEYVYAANENCQRKPGPPPMLEQPSMISIKHNLKLGVRNAATFEVIAKMDKPLVVSTGEFPDPYDANNQTNTNQPDYFYLSFLDSEAGRDARNLRINNPGGYNWPSITFFPDTPADEQLDVLCEYFGGIQMFGATVLDDGVNRTLLVGLLIDLVYAAAQLDDVLVGGATMSAYDLNPGGTFLTQLWTKELGPVAGGNWEVDLWDTAVGPALGAAQGDVVKLTEFKEIPNAGDRNRIRYFNLRTGAKIGSPIVWDEDD